MVDQQTAALQTRLAADYRWSVTELELYLMCPQGWFASRVLKLPLFPNREREIGTRLHRILEQIFQQSPAHRQSQLLTAISSLRGLVSAQEQAQLQRQLARIIARHSGPTWPGEVVACELRLRSTTVLGDQRPLIARLDRLDRCAAGLLVIDYKTNAAPALTGLQPFLYPLMAAEAAHEGALGAIYVALRTGQHRGALRERMAGLDDPEISADWQTQAEQAVTRARQAVTGILAGDWHTRGVHCPYWCPHHLLDQAAQTL